MGKRRKKRGHKKEPQFKSKIKILLSEKEVYIPWIQLDLGYSYSFVRDLNVFEWLILKCLTQEFEKNDPDLHLNNIALIAGLDDRGIDFLRPFVDNFCQNTMLLCNDTSNIDHLQSYEITDDGLKLFLKGKTSVKEKSSSIRLYYSPIIKSYIKERNLNFNRPQLNQAIFLKAENEIFQNLNEINIEQFKFQDYIDDEILTSLLYEFRIFPPEDTVTVNKSLNFESYDLMWERRKIRIGWDNLGLLRAELNYNDRNFNEELSNLLVTGELCDNLIETKQDNSIIGSGFHEIKNWFSNSKNLYPKSELNKNIKVRYKKKDINCVILSDQLNEYVNLDFNPKFTAILLNGKEGISNFSEIDNNNYKLEFYLTNHEIPPVILIDNYCYECGKILINESENISKDDMCIEIIKEYNLPLENFISKYYLKEQIIEIGKVIEANNKEHYSDEKIELLYNWNKNFGNYYDLSKEIRDKIIKSLSSKNSIDEENEMHILSWIKEMSAEESSVVVNRIFEIKYNAIRNDPNFEKDLRFLKNIQKRLIMQNRLEKKVSDYFLFYFPFLGNATSENINYKELKEKISQINKLNLKPLYIQLYNYLIDKHIPPENLSQFSTYLNVFSSINSENSRESKQFLQSYILNNSVYLIDLKLSVLDNTIQKNIRDKNRKDFYQILDSIHSFDLILPNYSIFEQSRVKNEINLLKKLKIDMEKQEDFQSRDFYYEGIALDDNFKPIIFDGSNIARNNQSSKIGDLNDVLLCKSNLIKQGIPQQNIFIIFGSGLRHFLKTKKQKEFYEELIKEKNINQAPRGQDDDWFIINFAIQYEGVIITNDTYKEYQNKDKRIKEFLDKNIINYTILHKKIVFEQNFLEKIKI